MCSAWRLHGLCQILRIWVIKADILCKNSNKQKEHGQRCKYTKPYPDLSYCMQTPYSISALREVSGHQKKNRAGITRFFSILKKSVSKILFLQLLQKLSIAALSGMSQF